ncbi:hypothetical protein Q3O60_15535 [Alkalimonas collagenimarina]|uniref:Uncharacterized protein n=1 Tax=Alkalimonas collagenimarina TaxID=400390 RepID=A0ABT9H2R2_9GAMM|nr:hypothetical protein [Alkalimonas collagenimarina]MDP4537598.1 hypothetical protein [Alkalimonas collagenimarina]
MKNIIFCGVFTGLGSAIYQIVAHGFSGMDLYRAIFTGLFVMLVYGLYAGFKWIMSEDNEA